MRDTTQPFSITVDAWAAKTRLPLATMHEFLDDLVADGFAERLEGIWFRLTDRGERLMRVIRQFEDDEREAA
jgi:DNA-binding IclR family transcriptional regulator